MTNYYYFSWDAGWGDTLWHLTNALIHCENSNQDMLIDLRGHWSSKGDKNVFNEYFSFIDTNINIITNEESIDKLKKDSEKHTNKTVKIKNPLKSKEDTELFYNTFSRIKPSESVTNTVKDIVREKFKGNYMVGVHARMSNGEVKSRFEGARPMKDAVLFYKERINDILFNAPRAFLKSCKDYKFFIASDSRKFVDIFKDQFPNTVSIDRYFAPPGCGTGHEIGEDSTEEQLKLEEVYGKTKIAKEALVDFYLLQETNFLFKNFSRFNEFCLYKGIPNFHINFQEKCY